MPFSSPPAMCVCVCACVWFVAIHMCVTFFRHGLDTQLSYTMMNTLSLISGSGSGSREGRSSKFGAQGGVLSIEYISRSTKVEGGAIITGERTTGT